MKKLGILVVDDSSLARGLISDIVSNEDDMYIAGEAVNGKEACGFAKKVKPNLITMDITMPVMNGLEAIEEIMATNPVPILVLTSVHDAEIAYQAIGKGALEVFCKPQLHDEDKSAFAKKIRFLAKAKVIRHIRTNKKNVLKSLSDTASTHKEDSSPIVIGIASSIGGPKALVEILSNLPGDLPASIIIAQHIGKGFSSGLVHWLSELSPIQIKTAAHHEHIIQGTVYIAPDNYHISIDKQHCINLKKTQSNDLYTPSANTLLTSIAQQCKDQIIGIILSGMGNDGVEGMGLIKKSRGITIAQDQQTCVVYGMPKEAIETDCIDHVLPITHIAKKIISIINSQAKGTV